MNSSKQLDEVCLDMLSGTRTYNSVDEIVQFEKPWKLRSSYQILNLRGFDESTRFWFLFRVL